MTRLPTLLARACVLTLVALSLSAADVPEPPTSAAAVGAERKYAEAMDKAREEFIRAAVAADRKRVADLQVALKVAFNKRDRDETKRIEAALELAKAALAEHAAGSALGTIAGKWKVEYANGVTRHYVIASDGRVQFPAERHTGTLRGGVLDLGDGNVERVTPAGERLLVEHWHPKGEFPKSRPILAVAERER